jgi:hypothetical protein
MNEYNKIMCPKSCIHIVKYHISFRYSLYCFLCRDSMSSIMIDTRSLFTSTRTCLFGMFLIHSSRYLFFIGVNVNVLFICDYVSCPLENEWEKHRSIFWQSTRLLSLIMSKQITIVDERYQYESSLDWLLIRCIIIILTWWVTPFVFFLLLLLVHVNGS